MVGALPRQINPFFLLRCLLAVSLLSCLSACGGGGGSSSISASAVVNSFSVQGSILVSAGSVVDSDLNNVSNINVPNNTPATAQDIPSFTELGGYVNQAGTGPAGPLFAAGDPLDYFRVYLYEGQSIVLDIYDADNADLDMYLLNATGSVILDYPLSTGNTEQLNAPFDGIFQILVEAVSGASNYTLRTQQTVNLGSTGTRLSDAFVPNELIVRYRQPYHYQQQLYRTGSTLNRFHLQSSSGESSRAMRLSMNTRPRPESSDYGFSSDVTSQIDSGQLRFLNSRQEAKYRTLQALKAMQEDQQVLYAQANIQLQSASVPNDPRYAEQWSLPLIELPAAWDTTTGSSQVIVAVIDSGILSGHPDLAPNLIAGYDFIADSDNAMDGDGLDADPEDLGPSYHGTHVAGIIAGVGNNGTGTTGVAWRTSIMPLRVLGKSGGNLYDAIQAIRYAAGLSNDSGLLPARPADIINLSVGGTGYCQDAYRETLSEVRQKNILVVAAAGNGDDDSNRFVPANCNDVFAVSAVDYNRQLAPYSNSGNVIDLAAPGGRDDVDQDSNGIIDGILSQSGEQTGSLMSYLYQYRYGTSMAAPHVSGVFALMLAVNPALGVDDVEQMLLSGLLTDDLGIAGRDNHFGHGLINARKAVAAAADSLSGSSGLGSYLISSINGFEFRPSLVDTEFETRRVGVSAITINAINKSADWLNVTQLGAADGVSQWRLSVNRAGLTAGLYQDTLSFVTSSNTLNLNILLQVNDPGQIYELGPLQISLLNTASNSTARIDTLDDVNGTYLFSFNNLDPGNYRLRVSSDLNGDGQADAGEAFTESQAFNLGNNLVLSPLSLTWDSPLISSPTD